MPAVEPGEKLATDDGVAGVDYRKGLLSVVSDHATLEKVLKLVGNKIGADIEISNDLAKEAVVAHLGPAAPSEVLHQLLDGPTVDYIIMGGDQVSRIIVRRKLTFGRQPLGPMQTKSTPAATNQDAAQQPEEISKQQEPENVPDGQANPPL
jgi:hypothetical protein